MRLLTRLLSTVCFIGMTAVPGWADGPDEPAESVPEAEERERPQVKIQTSHGDITIELYPDRAPITVENFLQYVEDDFYSGTIFHRVMPGFMIQGGGFDADMNKRPTRPPIQNEADNGLRNERGTLAMARTMVVDSATSQFFINHSDNAFLDHRDRSPQGFGYCVFGRVTEGMDVVDQIARVRTTTRAGHEKVPVEPVVIDRVKLVD